MKKSYSEAELKEKASDVFEQFPNAEKAFATADGNVFLERNRAEIHAGPKGQVLEVGRPIKKEEKVSNKADDLIKAIAEIQKLEDLEQFKTDKRATVIKALEEKTAELEAAKNPE